jgi:aryl-alcohol dehydrogenase-like predicted oxidoreductase
MEYVKMGATGLKVSRICLGCMSFGKPNERWPWALEEEQSQAILGRALRDFASRDHVVIATKVYSEMGPAPNDRGLSRKHILTSIDASLKRLQTDYVDLYQIHRWDYDTPIEETLEALNDVVRAGKARYIGASSMYAWQFARALFTSDLRGWARFVSMQDYYNMAYREEEREMLPLCRDQGIGVIPWSPLARGLLARKPSKERDETLRARTDAFGRRLYSDDDLAVVEQVYEVAEARGLPMAQVALSWMLDKSFITAPIIGATRMQHLEDAVAALSVHLSAEETKRMEEAYRPHPTLGFT